MRQSILGITFDLVGYEHVYKGVCDWRADGIQTYLTITPPHSVLMSLRDPAMREATMNARLTLPDGIGIIWAANILGYPHQGRVTGPTLMLKLCDWGREERLRHYFYGGAETVAGSLAQRLAGRYPGIQVVGSHCQPFRALSEDEDKDVVARINAAEPDIVWVGLGAPKQEKWMHAHLGSIRATVMIGVGAAFDFHSGNARWASTWVREAGLEWLWRLILEPRRMWRRNLDSPVFLMKVLAQRCRERRKGKTQETEKS